MRIPVLPQVMKIIPGSGRFQLNKKTKIVCGIEQPVDLLMKSAVNTGDCSKLLADSLNSIISKTPKIIKYPLTESCPSNIIFIASNLNDPALNSEGYHLDILSTGIFIRGNSTGGLVNGIQTLMQLIRLEAAAGEASEDVLLPCVSIRDEPAFQWRGILLDCVRHFIPIERLYRLVDLLALYKLNRLHLHLTDDQGWRIEIKKHPLLTEIGSWRNDSENQLVGGYYLQSELRALVRYARIRNIEIIPEIDLPGHTRALLAAYPKYSCTESILPVPSTWGVFEDVLCPGHPELLDLIGEIIEETLAVFPFHTMHIGGDECPVTRWSNCPRCRSKMQKLGLEKPGDLQGWLNSEISSLLEKSGRKIIGWDDILRTDIPENTIIQIWQGLDRVEQARAAGSPMIISPVSHTYFDYSPSVLSLKKVHSLKTILRNLASEMPDLILGGECCVWTERIPPEKLDEMIFPRLLAAADCFWGQGNTRDDGRFIGTAWLQYEMLNRLGVKIRKGNQ